MSERTMRKTALLLAIIVMFFVLPSFAAKTVSEKKDEISSAMQKSERYINSIINESSENMRATLFQEFVSSRLKYATVRSLSRLTGSKWLGCVNICEELSNGEHVDYILERSVVQYGYDRLPERTNSATIRIGDISSMINYSGESVFSFDNIVLGENAIKDPVELGVNYYNNYYQIALSDNYPNKALDPESAVKAMASAYTDYVNDRGEYELIDHAVLKLKSYISNYDTAQSSYYWELYLVHGDELPAPATLIRYYVSSDTAKIYERTLRSYF